MEKKMSTTSELLCHGLPEEFQVYLQQVMDLNFEEQPAYEHYRQQFRALTKRVMRAQGFLTGFERQASLAAKMSEDGGGSGKFRGPEVAAYPVLDWIA
jgi:hypothetical protein